MSIKTHHGAPGSYKTSLAVQDDFIKAVRAGRPIVTNIRGLNDGNKILRVINQNSKKQIQKLTLCHIDTKTQEQREYFSRFYEWAPVDTYFVIDEVNTIFPSENTIKYYRENNKYNGDYVKDKRPADIVEAFEMHRHYNWDFSFTTPSISKVHKSMIRDVSEMEYYHKNRATIGLKGCWEIIHYAGTTGRNKSDQIAYRSRKIDKWIYDLYSSTETGQVRDSISGINVFLQPANFVILALLFAGGSYVYANNPLKGKFKAEQQSETNDKQETIYTETIIRQNTDQSTRNSHSDSHHKVSQDILISNENSQYFNFIQGLDLYIVGTVNRVNLYESQSFFLNSIELKKHSIKEKQLSKCLVTLSYLQQIEYISCKPRTKPGLINKIITTSN